MNMLFVKLLGLAFTLAAGTLAHFFYPWSGKNPIVGLVAAVNESTWEHLKLLFFPMLVASIAEYLFLNEQYPNFMISQAVGMMVGMVTIVVLFYTYSGVLGYHFLLADILPFVIGAVAGFGVSLYLLRSGNLSDPAWEIAGKWTLVMITVMFLLFTKHPPRIGLFRDPLTGGYGG